MDKPVLDIHQSLQKMIGLHRQLLELVRAERVALVEADLKAVQDATVAKQALIEAIGLAETERQKHLGTLALLWKRPVKELSVSAIILLVQARDLKLADQIRSTWNTLSLLLGRIAEQNRDNRILVEKSLEHIHEMKRNVLGEANPQSGTYTPQGQRSTAQGAARFISREA